MAPKPLHQSTQIPGLVMWPNGAIVRVAVDDEGVIRRDRDGKPYKVIVSYGRVDLPGLEEKVFDLVERRESLKRRKLLHDVEVVIVNAVIRAASRRRRK